VSNRLVWRGLDELRRGLDDLATTLTRRGEAIAAASAHAAEADIRRSYPRRTGALQQGLRVDVESAGPYAVRYVVRNTHPLAGVFEMGTAARHTALGANRGAMPPGRVFVPRMQRERRAMYEEMKAAIAAEGLVVSGEDR
jgi:hypothetical protein